MQVDVLEPLAAPAPGSSQDKASGRVSGAKAEARGHLLLPDGLREVPRHRDQSWRRRFLRSSPADTARIGQLPPTPQ